MTREERIEWTLKRDRYEQPLIEKARREGRIPVIDCTVPGYPVPQAILRELALAESPEYREARYREATSLRKKATQHRSLANVLAAKEKHADASRLRAQAENLDSQAAVIEDAMRA